MPSSVLALAPAKLNLALSVGPPGVDGMHPISSWMVTVDLHDELLVTRLPEGSFSRYAILWHDEARRRSDIDWSITKDLAVRAHLALERETGRSLPVQLKLEKRIPVGGGLGGGSSNAAAMLHAVDRLYGLGLGIDRLAEIGHGLGSDVPFLVHGGSAIAEGLGERIERHGQVPELHAVLAFPPEPCPTGPVYRAFDRLRPDARVDAARVRSLVRGDAPPDPAACFNDLAAAAFDVAAPLAGHARRLAGLAERPAHVSGSGSTLFCLCDDPLHAEALAGAVSARLDLPAVAVRGCRRPEPVADPETQAKTKSVRKHP
jgi:4-diphosphocytidyl-2-C-methyl-D-erythritol kinase